MSLPLPALARPDLEAAAALIGPHTRRTPIVTGAAAEFDVAGGRLTFKLECLQHAGSFKTRGAFANLLMREVPAAGVAAASGGNHGTAVAYAARQLGVPARIFVPTVCSPAKIERIRSYGAELVVGGDRYADALEACAAWTAQSGALPVHAFDQRETLLGTGTVAIELAQQDSSLDTVLVPVGGGGLIGGIAAWYKGAVRVVGVEPEGAPTLTDALRAGQPVDAPAGSIAADSLAPKRVGELVFPLVKAYVERVVLVSDAHIAEAQARLWDRLRIVAEPGGAAAFAALVGGRYVPSAGERVGVVISGANTVIVRPA